MNLKAGTTTLRVERNESSSAVDELPLFPDIYIYILPIFPDILDAFQMKSLRRILNVPPTFIDRTQTNQVVREQVEQYGVDATNFSQVWKNQKLKLLFRSTFPQFTMLKLFGHILRANHKDPLRQVLFSYNSFAPRNIPLTQKKR